LDHVLCLKVLEEPTKETSQASILLLCGIFQSF
jgi:hypothetical protein